MPAAPASLGLSRTTDDVIIVCTNDLRDNSNGDTARSTISSASTSDGLLWRVTPPAALTFETTIKVLKCLNTNSDYKIN